MTTNAPSLDQIRDALLSLSDALGAIELPASRAAADLFKFCGEMHEIASAVRGLARGLDAFEGAPKKQTKKEN